MPQKIPSDSTIATVWPHLASPRQYVAGARHKMEACVKKHGNAQIKIGVTGTGQKPCYRILYRSTEAKQEIYGSYWDNHDPLTREDAINTNWSSVVMEFDAVDAFLKDKIGWKPPGAQK